VRADEAAAAAADDHAAVTARDRVLHGIPADLEG
jgi:hypothetical protein